MSIFPQELQPNIFTLHFGRDPAQDCRKQGLQFKTPINQMTSPSYAQCISAGLIYLTEKDLWEVSLVNLVIANNFKTFPTADDGDNCSAYFDITFKFKKGVYKLRSYFQHKHYHIMEVIAFINKQMQDFWLPYFSPSGGENCVGKFVADNIFNLLVDPVSDKLKFQTNDPDREGFANFIKTYSNLNYTYDPITISLSVSDDLYDYLGPFNKPTGPPFMPSDSDLKILWQLQFYTTQQPETHFKDTIIPTKITSIQILSSLVGIDTRIGVLAKCSVPEDESEPVTIATGGELYPRVIKHSKLIEAIDIKIIDARSKKVIPYKGGSVFLSLQFKKIT